MQTRATASPASQVRSLRKVPESCICSFICAARARRREGPRTDSSAGPFATRLHHVPALSAEATLASEELGLGARRRPEPSRGVSERHRIAHVREWLVLLPRRAL